MQLYAGVLKIVPDLAKARMQDILVHRQEWYMRAVEKTCVPLPATQPMIHSQFSVCLPDEAVVTHT
jgi:hypothetical protein